MSIFWLNSEQIVGLDEAGSKAVGLVRLNALGLRIPPGFVISTSGFRTFINNAGLELTLDSLATCSDPERWQPLLDRIDHGIDIAPWPESLRTSIISAYRQLSCRVAVRSSGISEDSDRSSFAGGYASFLNRSDEEEVLASIRKCWRSGFSDNVVAYRRQHGITKSPWLMGVIVQKMVDADKAGVLFTRNPFDEDNCSLLEAVSGGCEQLVAGQPAELSAWVDRVDRHLVRVETDDRSPRTFPAHSFPSFGQPRVRKPHLLRPKEISALVDIGLRVESSLGSPQDIEWAIVGVDLILLQARPLTASRSMEGR